MAGEAPTLHECHGCGLRQLVPPLAPQTLARCIRCRTVLRGRRRNTIEHSLAIAFAALVLLGVTASATMMTVQAGGIVHRADLAGGPEELVRRGMLSLGAAVVFTSLLAPAAKLAGTIYALGLLQTRRPPRHIRRVFLIVRKLTPWSMSEVLLLGAFVAYVKLQALVTITAGPALISLVALAFTMFWLDSELDAQDVWEEMQRKGVGEPVLPPGPAALACHSCGLLSTPDDEVHPCCARCGSALHRRKPNSVARTWALVISATILYIPANYYPVLTVIQLGSGAPSTILGGVEELIDARQWPLAALVFLASIAIPLLKLVGLATMLTCTQLGASGWLRERTLLFAIVEFIGRWSMIDIFMESLLGALVQFGTLITIDPGMGAVAFCGVVILTMFAAETFDPRLMWDAAAGRVRAAS
ncbi:MAG TPA: PqiA/YebS family transporter subunit [Acetobacteraceae bacterium]|nr:PqiA/YebS family transporter subunit [Acetobacteraceae bacterium]